MIQVNHRVLEIEYAIRDVVLPARELEKKGAKIIKLNIGDPVPFGLDAPTHAKEAYCKAIMEGKNYYAASDGIPELKEAIAKREMEKNKIKLETDDILVTAAVTEALQFTFLALGTPGAEFLVPDPSYPPYISLAKLLGGNPIGYKTSEELDWQPDLDDMRKKITEKTKALAVINPNNPTGAVYDKKTIKDILDLAGEYNLPVVSDEIYDLMIYDKDHVSPGSLTKDVPVIVMNGASKVYFATGWRIGYMYKVDLENKLDDFWEGVNKMARLRLCPNTPGEYGFLAAISGPMDYLDDYMKELRERRDFAWKRLNEIPGISAVKPEGAFYIFPKIEMDSRWKSDKEFVLDFLHKEHVLLVHGSGFGKYGKDHFRAVFLPPVNVLEEAFNRLERFMKSG